MYKTEGIVSDKEPIHKEALKWFPIGYIRILGIRLELADS